jgi:hypothetical protein
MTVLICCSTSFAHTALCVIQEGLQPKVQPLSWILLYHLTKLAKPGFEAFTLSVLRF